MELRDSVILSVLENVFLKLSASYKIRMMLCPTFVSSSLSHFYPVLPSISLVAFPKLEACENHLLL